MTCEQTDDLQGWVMVLFLQGVAKARTRDYESALEAHDRAWRMAKRIDDQLAVLMTRLARGEAHRKLQKPAEAMADFTGVLESLRNLEHTDQPLSLETFEVFAEDRGLPTDFISQAGPYLDLVKPLVFRAIEVTVLSRIAKIHYDQRSYAKAIAVQEQALARAPLEILKYPLLQEIGQTKAALKEWAEASRYLERAYAGAVRFSDSNLSMLCLNDLAGIDADRQRPEMALRGYERLLKLARRYKEREWESTALNNMGQTLTVLDRDDLAIVHLTRSLEIAKDIRNPTKEIQTSMNLVSLYLSLGRLSDAKPLLRQSRLNLQELGNETMLARILEAEGVVHRFAGRYEEARRSWSQALEKARAEQDSRLEIEIINNLSYLDFARGNYQDALLHHRRVLDLARAIPDPHAEAAGIMNLAFTYLSLGYLEEPYRYARQALDKARQLGDREIQKVAELLVVRVQTLMGEYHEARARLPGLLERTRDSGDPVGEITSLLFMSNIAEDPEDALDFARQALTPARRQNLVELESMALVAAGAAYLRLKRFELAEETFRSCSTLVESMGHSADRLAPQESMSSMGIAAAVFREGHRGQAIEGLASAIDLLESIQNQAGADEHRLAFLRITSQVYSMMIHLSIGQGSYARAFEYAERGRAPVFLRRISGHNREARGPADQGTPAKVELLRRRMTVLLRQAEAVRNKGKARPAERRDEEQLRQELKAVRHAYEQLLVEADERETERSGRLAFAPLELAEIQRKILPAETTMLYFYMGQHDKTRVVVWIIERDRMNMVSLDLTREEVFSGLQHQLSMIRGRDFDKKTADELFRRLFAPLVPFIRHTSLVIVPHGPLHYLPFAAMWNAQTGRFLVEDYSTTYAPSASALRFLHANQSPNHGRILLLGDADGSLPHANQEVLAIADLFGGMALVGSEAKESRIHLRKAEVDILHLATHASHEAVNPLFSYLDLQPGAGHDGRLEVHEIYGLDLTGTNLVVLSACDTFLGKHHWGDEIKGMTRAFLHAGSPAVVTSLWNLDDQASAELMEGFYESLLTATSSAEALRQAQLRLLKVEEWSSPYYWSGYVLTGDARWNAPGSDLAGADF